MKIGRHNTDDKVVVIAEIGNNHEGDFDLAIEMIRQAARAGADIVKFQTIVPEKLVSLKETERIKQLKRFEFSEAQFRQLADEAGEQGIDFMSTPFDVDSVAWLDEIVCAWKVASCDNNFYPLLDRIAETGKSVIVSMGLGQHSEAVGLIDFFSKRWGKGVMGSEPSLAMLHCVVSYPTPDNEAGLSGITELKAEGVTCGYSDHTIGIKAAELAVAAGARIIEKHFTVDKNHSDFRDHQLSADPSDLREMIAAIRKAEELMGDSGGKIQSCEEANHDPVRRSLTAIVDISPGETLSMDQLAFVRPGGGIAPGKESEILGKTVTSAITAGDQISLDYIN